MSSAVQRNPQRPTRIAACIVNHNTSPFAELALRSFQEAHRIPRPNLDLDLVLTDNHSEDEGIDALRVTADELNIPFVLSRWPAKEARCNTHGDVLRDFVLDHADADLFMFIDADVMFDERDTLWTMAGELNAADDLWSVQARNRWLEERAGVGASMDVWAGTPLDLWVSIDNPPNHSIKGRHKARCHPFCVLVRNSDAFLRVTEIVGLSAAATISQDEDVAGFADTLGPASRALATHKLRYELSAATVTHFGNVTHMPEAEVEPNRTECIRLLERYRQGC